jgi:hypothetical protein
MDSLRKPLKSLTPDTPSSPQSPATPETEQPIGKLLLSECFGLFVFVERKC